MTATPLFVKPERPSERRKRIVTAYVSDRLRREYEAEGRGYVARIERATGFSSAHVSSVKDGNRGVGQDFEVAMERFWKLPEGELSRIAEQWCRENRPEEVLEVEERYPNRAKARGMARDADVSDQAIRDVLADAAHSDMDYPVATWLRLFLNRQQMLDDLSRGRGLPGRTLDDDEG